MGLQEVESEAAVKLYLAHAGAGKWAYHMSTSGKSDNPSAFQNDYLVFMYRTDMFRLLEAGEYHASRSKPGDGTYGRSSPRLRGMLYIKLLHSRISSI